MNEPVVHSIVNADSTLLACVEAFAQNREGVVVFTAPDGLFCGLLTAGDAFRLLARGVRLDEPIRTHINTKPITVSPEYTSAEILQVMTSRDITLVPVVRADGTLERIVTQASLLKERILRNRAVIMAGGDGVRLRPITETIPKALVELNGKPALQVVIERLRQFGITDITICVRYRADEIRRVVRDGSPWHVNVTYVEEDSALGTAGALSLIDDEGPDPFFVVNCDVISDIDLVNMHRFHVLNQSQMTVAVKSHDVEVPFGVVEVDHERVVRLSEKPKMRFYVNAGIYLLEPSAKRLVPAGRRYDITDLIQELLDRKAAVCSFPIRSAWFDIGDHATLERARTLNW